MTVMWLKQCNWKKEVINEVLVHKNYDGKHPCDSVVFHFFELPIYKANAIILWLLFCVLLVLSALDSTITLSLYLDRLAVFWDKLARRKALRDCCSLWRPAKTWPEKNHSYYLTSHLNKVPFKESQEEKTSDSSTNPYIMAGPAPEFLWPALK